MRRPRSPRRTAPPNDSSLLAPAGFRLRTWEYPVATWRYGLVCNTCGYCADPPDPASASQSELDQASRRHACPPPTYHWDFWRREAAARGVDPVVADLGRTLLREESQHGWGTGFDPERLIRDALRAPTRTAAHWRWLLREGR